jgi:hypothetical protein
MSPHCICQNLKRTCTDGRVAVPTGPGRRWKALGRLGIEFCMFWGQGSGHCGGGQGREGDRRTSPTAPGQAHRRAATGIDTSRVKFEPSLRLLPRVTLGRHRIYLFSSTGRGMGSFW